MPFLPRISFSAVIRTGLVLGALFGWLLSFPMFGPLLFARTGEAVSTLGQIFVFSHGAGLLAFHRLPLAGSARRWLVWGAGALVAGLTLAFSAAAAAPFAPLFMAVIGPAAAVLVLAWVDTWLNCGDRLAALAVAMASANLVMVMVTVPRGLPSGPWLALAAGLALGSSLLLAAPPCEAAPTAATVRPQPSLLRGSIIAIAAFALADYFVGGIWYNILSRSAQSIGPWQPPLESLSYVLAIGVLYWQVRRRQSEELALYSLCALGMGLLVAASGVTGYGAVFAFRAILLIGLAAGDLFFWDQLGRLGLTYGGRRSLGIGLGASLLLIGLANWAAGLAAPEAGGPGLTFLLVGAALLFLVIPVIAPHLAVGPAEPAMATPPAAEPVQIEAPAGLTPAERQVYQLLVSGATDQEIAATLVISPHTVKFHVRNVLHKAGVANRKELLSRLVAQSAAAAKQKED